MVVIRFLLTSLIIYSFTTSLAAREPTPVTVEMVAKGSMSWNGTSLPAYPAGQPEVTLLRIRIPAGVELPMHLHPVINVGLMIKGELTVTTERGEIVHLRAGDPIIEVVDQWHMGRNGGSETAEIVVFYAGVAGKEITIKRMDQQIPQ